MKAKSKVVALGLAAVAVVGLAHPAFGQAQDKGQIGRGKYLATFGGCDDCHTPKLMTPKGPQPDPARRFSGYPADAQLPAVPANVLGPSQWGALTNGDLTAWAGPWGVSFAANITPDKATGIGNWTTEDFTKAMRTGKHLGVGRPILPPMPWFAVAALNDRDIKALFAYLKSVKPIANAVPAPIPPK
jgi:mono/diheme cytochrome c family protein